MSTAKINFSGKSINNESFDAMDVDKGDYLTDYRHFFEWLSSTKVDDFVLKVFIPTVSDDELPGEIFAYAMQYLDLKDCPPSLVTPMCRAVLDASTKACVEDPTCLKIMGKKRAYHSLKVMSHVVQQVHLVAKEYLDNALAASLPPPRSVPSIVVATNRNGMRRMEDRHVVIDDLNYLCDIESAQPAGFYAVYDGHCGPLAAVYAAAHLHMIMARHPFYLQNPQMALRHAFVATDEQFNNTELAGGSTGTVCYLQGNKLLVGWVGDSRAVLVKNGAVLPVVNPHRPNRFDEETRIVKMGGFVSNNGTWRVNDILAVSRAIGDMNLKPYITSEPDFLNVNLDGTEDFLVIASDGLWDFVSDDDVAKEVYNFISTFPDDLKKVADRVVQVAKANSSTDNISVLLVLLKDPHKIAEQAQHIQVYSVNMDSSFDNSSYNSQNNMFHVNTNQDVAFSKEGLLFDIADGIKQQNGNTNNEHPVEEHFNGEKFTNGKGLCNMMCGDDDDLGPETDVDAVDDIHTSPSMEAARALAEGHSVHGDFSEDDAELHGKEDEDIDSHRPVREETPTPPADAGVEIVSGLVDNVAESGGEESEDEWNYIKGEEKNNLLDPQLLNRVDTEVVDIASEVSKDNDDDDDDMNSPLNPDAPPFVPVTPSQGVSPDISAIPSRLLPDEVLSQSPQKPVPMDDIDIPEAKVFESEISTRYADLGNMNGHYDNSALSSQENLKEALHGNEKQSSDYAADESGDIPVSSAGGDFADQAEFDRIQKDTTDFCDVQVAFSQHTSHNLVDEGIDEELYERLKNKERDPMSMSFYQEKDEDTCEIQSNPFDLNAVQPLPNNSDEEFDDHPQPDNSLYGMNPFAQENVFVTSSEINAAISHIDSAVTHVEEVFDSAEHMNPSPIIIEKSETASPNKEDLVSSPVSDNISQLTEPSEHEIVDQNIVVSSAEHDIMDQDVNLSPVMSPIPAPIQTDNVCEPLTTDFEKDYPLSNTELATNDNETFGIFSTEPTYGSQFETSFSKQVEETTIMNDVIPTTDFSEILTQKPTIELKNDFDDVCRSPELILQSSDNIGQSPEPLAVTAQSPELVAHSPEVLDYHSESITHPLSPQSQSPYPNTISPITGAQSPMLDVQSNIPDMQECNAPISPSPVPETQFIPETESSIFTSQSPIPETKSDLFNQMLDLSTDIQKTTEEVVDDFIEQKQTFESDFLTQIEKQTCEIVESNVVENVMKTTDFLTDEICKPMESHDEIQETFSKTPEIEFNQKSVNQLADLLGDVSLNEVKDAKYEVEETLIETEKIENVESVPQDVPVPENLSFSEAKDIMVDSLEKKEDSEIMKDEQLESKKIDLVTPLEIAAATGATAAAIAAVATVTSDDKKSKSKPTTPAIKKTTSKTATSSMKAATSPTKAATSSPTKTATSPTKPVASPTKSATPKVSATATKKPTTPIAKTSPTTPTPKMTTTPKTPVTKTVKSAPATSPTKPASKVPSTTATAPKPKSSTTTTTKTTTTIDKKPLTNGDLKKEVVKKTTTTTTSTAKAPSAVKSAVSTTTKTSTVTRTSITGTTRPTTAPARTSTTTRPAPTLPASGTTAPIKASKPTPTPATRALATKAVGVKTTKAPITDKMTKDSTNKQISASRPTPAPRTAISAKTSDAKSGTKTVTKTTTTTTKSTNPVPIKRPAGMTKAGAIKTTKTTTKVVEKIIDVEKQNGTLEKSEKEEVILQQETCINGTPLITDIPLKEDLVQQMDDLKQCFSY